MPEFGRSFSGNRCERKLSQEELIRSIRFMVAAEYEAVQLYMELAESTDDKRAIALLKEVADDERVHAGCFLELLKTLCPDECDFYKKGEDEAAEIIKKATK